MTRDERIENTKKALGGMTFPEGTQALFGRFYDDLQGIGLSHKQVKNVGFALMIAAHVMSQWEVEQEQIIKDGVGGAKA